VNGSIAQGSGNRRSGKSILRMFMLYSISGALRLAIESASELYSALVTVNTPASTTGEK
jgi:hypothetical protein